MNAPVKIGPAGVKNIIKFSSSDNFFLAFWLGQWISVTGHYTFVSPYMANEFGKRRLLSSKVFGGKRKSRGKNGIKHQIWWTFYRGNTKNYGQRHPGNYRNFKR